MTLTCVACYGTPYEEYHPEYIISGRVVDPEGNAIKGIRVNNGGEFEDREVTTPRHQYYVELGDVELKRKQN